MRRALALGLLLLLLASVPVEARSVLSLDGDSINVRAGPGQQYPVLRTLAPGEHASLLEIHEDWYFVRLPDGSTGYMASWVTRVDFSDDLQDVWITADALDVRSQPDPSASAVGRAHAGERYRLYEIAGEWWRIGYGATGGWVPGDHAVLVPAVPPDGKAPSPGSPPNPAPHLPEPPGSDTAVPDASALPSPGAPRRAAGKGVTVTAAVAAVRLGRDDAYEIRDWAVRGEVLTYVSAADGWIRVVTPRGVEGWVRGDTVELWDGRAEWERTPVYRVAPGVWEIRYLPVVTVNGADARLRDAWGEDGHPILAVPAGVRAKILSSRAGYLEVLLPDGSTGWLRQDATGAELPPPRVEHVVLRLLDSGAYRLEVTGNLSDLVIRSSDETGLLSLYLPDTGALFSQLPVSASGVLSVAAGGGGVEVRFEQIPGVTEVERSAQRVVLDLTATLTGIRTEDTAAGDRVYHVTVKGSLTTRSARDNLRGTVVVTLPGALRVEASVPDEMRVVRSGAATQLVIATDRAHALRRTADGFDLVLYAPHPTGRRIVVDPGHGGHDPGATHYGLRESDVNLAVALRLRDLLRAQGAEVILTRDSDRAAVPDAAAAGMTPYERERAELSWRTDMANEAAADLFVSIHANASASAAAAGIETYWCPYNFNALQARSLAEHLQAQLVALLGRPDRGVREETFYVNCYTEAPSALVEIGFVTNPEENRLLASAAYQQAAAQALLRGILTYFGADPDQGGHPAEPPRAAGSPENMPGPGAAPDPSPDPDTARRDEPAAGEAAASRLAEDSPVGRRDRTWYEQQVTEAQQRGDHQPFDTYVEDREIDYDVRPLVQDGRTLVPVRHIAEALGAQVRWDAVNRVVTITGAQSEIRLVVGVGAAMVNGRVVPLDTVPQIVDGRTLVPLRFVAEQMGLIVTWLGDSRTIIITREPI